MIEAVLLDAGNTLFTERGSRGSLYAQVLRDTAGIERDPAALGAAIREVHSHLPRRVNGQYRYSRGWFQGFVPEVLQRVRVPSSPPLVEAFLRTFADPGSFQTFEEVPAVLAELRRRGLRLAVVSNWPPHLPEMLDGLGLREIFQEVVVSAREEREKPEVELFRRALQRLGVRPERALHVGDSWTNDVLGARDAGIAALHLQRSGAVDRPGSLPDLEGDGSVPRIADLRGLLDHLDGD